MLASPSLRAVGVPGGGGYRPRPAKPRATPMLAAGAHDGDEDMGGFDQGGGKLDPPAAGRCPARDDGKGGDHPLPTCPPRVRKSLQEFVAPADPSSFPMQEAADTRGRMCEGSVVLPLEVARAVVRASGRQPLVTGRRWMQGETSPIPGSMVWVRLPAEAQAPLPALWKKLASNDQLSPYFGGLVSGDQVGRMGVRILLEGPV